MVVKTMFPTPYPLYKSGLEMLLEKTNCLWNVLKLVFSNLKLLVLFITGYIAFPNNGLVLVLHYCVLLFLT